MAIEASMRNVKPKSVHEQLIEKDAEIARLMEMQQSEMKDDDCCPICLN
jgi:hypothetical protein